MNLHTMMETDLTDEELMRQMAAMAAVATIAGAIQRPRAGDLPDGFAQFGVKPIDIDELRTGTMYGCRDESEGCRIDVIERLSGCETTVLWDPNPATETWGCVVVSSRPYDLWVAMWGALGDGVPEVLGTRD